MTENNITTAPLTIAQQKGIIFTSESSEQTYHRLRTNIRDRFTKLIEAGTPLVEVSYKKETDHFTEYLERLDPESRRHYNCICCKKFLTAISTIGYVAEDLTVRSPLQEAFTEVLDGYTAKGIKYANPLFHVSEELTLEHKNGWSHFFAFTSEEAATMNEYLTKIDTNFVEQLRVLLNKPTMNSATLEKIYMYLKEKLYNAKPIGLINPLIKLIKQQETKAPGGLSMHDMLSVYYRFPNWDWMQGLKSSSAGNVLEYLRGLSDGSLGSLDRLVGQLNHQTDPLRHKRSVREASEQALKVDMDKLREMGLPRALERALVLPSDLTFAWTEHVEKPVEVEEVSEEGLSAAEKAMKGLLNTRKAKEAPNVGLAFLDKQISSSVIHRKVSMANFKESLSEYTKLSLAPSLYHLDMIPTIFTKPVDETDYSSIFNAYANGHSPRIPSRLVSIRDLESDLSKRSKIQLSAIHISEKGGLTAQTDVSREYMTKMMEGAGTMVLGVEIQSSLREHSRGWTEISKLIEPVISEEEPFFTGLGIAVGHTLLAEDAAGIQYRIEITSLT